MALAVEARAVLNQPHLDQQEQPTLEAVAAEAQTVPLPHNLAVLAALVSL